MVGFLQALSLKCFILSSHQLQNSSSPRASGRESGASIDFPQMDDPGGGAFCNGTLHSQSAADCHGGNSWKNGVVRETQVRGDPSPFIRVTGTLHYFAVKLFEAVLVENPWQEVFSTFGLFALAHFKCLATKKFRCGLRRDFLLYIGEETCRSKSFQPLMYKHPY